MAWITRTRSLRFLTSLVAVSLLLAPSADAQRKKPKKKPAATAKPHKGTKPAPPAAAAPAPAAPAEPEPAAAEPEPEPEPMPAKKGKKGDDIETPAPTESAEADTGVEHKEHAGDKASVAPLLDAEIGLKGFQRHLVYQNDANNNLPDYDLSGAPAIAIDVGIYPIRTSGFSAGVTAGFENAFSIGTTYREPQAGQEGTHATKSNAYSIGARGNLLFGSSSVGIGFEYAALNYTVDLPPPTPDNAQVPNVAYRFLRPSLSGRFGVSSRVSLLAGFGYLHVLSAGDIVSSDYFPGSITTASGFDVNLGVAWAPIASMKAFELRPMFGWRRIAFTFKPDPAVDPYVADGAHDDYLSLALMLGLRL
jgi:hypothetical protein